MTRSVVEIAAAMHSGSITARALAERFLDEQSRLDAQLHSFVAVRADDVLAQADRVDDERHRGVDRGPLHGVLIGVKDIVDVAAFLAWHEPDDLVGGVRANKAFEAFARIIEIEPERLQRIVKGE